jgi:Rrf2 family protein
MKLSTKSRYALEGLLYLAIHGGGSKPLSVKDIATGTGVTTAYMEQIFFSLKKSDLVTTVRGAKGGFILGKTEESITVGMIIRTIDGNIVPVKCVESLSSCTSRVRSNCLSRQIWIRLSDAISEAADRMTLKDLKNKYIAENGGADHEDIN